MRSLNRSSSVRDGYLRTTYVRTTYARAAQARTLRTVRLTRGALIALLALSALAMSACQMAEQSANVNQSRIWTDYELKYDANSDLTTAKASFRFGSSLGTPLDLTSPSEVRFNGETLARIVQPGTGFVSYERTFSGQVTSGTFRFVDTEGEAYSNTVSLKSVAFPSSIGTIDNDASHSLQWVGSALGTSEDVTVTLWRFGGNSAELGVFQQSEAGAQSVILTATQLRNIDPGDVTLRMTRAARGVPARTPDAGGRLSLEWTARDKVATIVD
jgi:hypothetical protein